MNRFCGARECNRNMIECLRHNPFKGNVFYGAQGTRLLTQEGGRYGNLVSDETKTTLRDLVRVYSVLS